MGGGNDVDRQFFRYSQPQQQPQHPGTHGAAGAARLWNRWRRPVERGGRSAPLPSHTTAQAAQAAASRRERDIDDPRPPAGARDVARDALLSCKFALECGRSWPRGVGGSPHALANMLSAIPHQMTLTSAELDADMLGVLLYGVRAIVLNSYYCPDEALERGDRRAARFQELIACALFSVWLVQPAFTDMVVLPLHWSETSLANPTPALWRTAWWMAMELLAPGPLLFQQTSQAAVIGWQAIWPTISSDLVQTKRDIIQADLIAHPQQPIAYDDETGPYWRSATLARAYANGAWDGVIRDALSSSILRARMHYRDYLADTPTLPLPALANLSGTDDDSGSGPARGHGSDPDNSATKPQPRGHRNTPLIKPPLPSPLKPPLPPLPPLPPTSATDASQSEVDRPTSGPLPPLRA